VASLKAAVVGTGLIATKKHLPAFRRIKGRCEVVAVCDVNLEAARRVANEFGVPHAYSDLATMLAERTPDLVDICTPPKTHADVAVRAIEGGASVLIEKPMAMNVEECDRIIEAASRRGKKVCVAHSDLFYPSFLRARRIVESGAIGTFMGMRVFLSTPVDYITSKPDHWAHKLPGGVIGETGPHIVYMTLAFLRPILEVRVVATKRLPEHPWSPFEDYRIELIGEKGVSTVTCVYTTDQWAAQVEVWGTRGMVRADLELMFLTRSRRTSLRPGHVAASGLREAYEITRDTLGTGLRVLSGRFERTHDALIGEFVTSIEERRDPPVSAEEGREAVRVMNLLVAGLQNLEPAGTR
jgi:predicted dehydrogenase